MLEPLITELATHLTADADRDLTTVAEAATDATTAYLVDRLRGTETKTESSVPSPSPLPVVDQALAGVVEDNNEFRDLESFKTAAYVELLGDLVGLDTDDKAPTVTIRVDPALVDAVTEHPSWPAQSREDVVATAVRWYVGSK